MNRLKSTHTAISIKRATPSAKCLTLLGSQGKLWPRLVMRLGLLVDERSVKKGSSGLRGNLSGHAKLRNQQVPAGPSF